MKEYDLINFGIDRYEKEILIKKIDGITKEYYKNGKLKYEGEYFYGKKWNGKIYDYNNNKIYEIKNGKGFIKEFSNEGILIF